jgi:ribosomal protein S18 acetylase RimI-like enzyme
MIVTLTALNLKNQDMTLLVNTIYKNFLELATEPRLNHNKTEIQKTLDSEGVVLFLILHENKIIGYLLGEVMDLEDKRHVLFISYIYVAQSMRSNGLGGELMTIAENFALNNKCIGVMLIFDTHNSNLVRFYERRGYMLDINLRRYERHDVFYKVV